MTRLFAATAAAAMLFGAPAFAQQTDAANVDTRANPTTEAALDRNAGDPNAAAPAPAAPAAQAAPAQAAPAQAAPEAQAVNPTVANADASAALGSPPSVYPVCKTRTQDRCRQPGEGTRTASRSRTHKSGTPAANAPANGANGQAPA